MEVTIARGVTTNGAPLFTCNTCGLSFPTADLQRQHMKTEWHRYNLKRRVAQLPPISAEIFAEKILQQQSQVEENDSSNKRGNKQRTRQITKKDKRLQEKQKRREALNNASNETDGDSDNESVNADTHSVVSSTFSLGDPVSAVDKSGELTDIESVPDYSDSETNDTQSVQEDDIDIALKDRLKRNKAIPSNVCFMTDKSFANSEENAEHMLKNFGMFIPEKEYLVDLDGLMGYLGEKVGLGNMCLYCNYEARSLEAIRAHMDAKRHVKIPYDTLDEKLEISDYYDFTSSYSKVTQGNDEEWEDLSGEENENDNGEDDDDDDDDDIPEDYYAPMVTETGLELAMGNLRAGHRSLARYYRQNLHSNTLSEDQGTLIAADRRINNLIKTKDPIRDKLQKQAFKDINRKKTQERRREGKTINHQAHFRDQLLQ